MESPSTRSEPHKSQAWMWLKLKRSIRTKLVHFGVLGALVLRCWRIAQWGASITKWKLTSLLSPSLKNIANLGILVDQVYWIAPQIVEYCALREFSLHGFKGRVIGGDWDTLTKPFEDLDIYLAMKEVCVEGRPWSDTLFYHRFHERVSNGEYLWGCHNPVDINQRLAFVEALYGRMKTEGYKSQEQLQTARLDRTQDEVAVCIGRDGDVLFSDGAHRLAAAKLLGIDRIPVKVSARHPGWIAFRKELLLYAHDLGGKLYQPALHPDLVNIPAYHECEDRFAAILERMPLSRGRLLDIGANIGYFCHRFEDVGFACHAVENWSRELYFLRRLRAIGKKTFQVLDESVLTCQSIRNTQFEVILCLNVFHHFLKTKESFNQFVDLLHNLRVEEMFFQPHVPSDPQMQHAYRNLSNDEFVLLVQNSTGLRYCYPLGEFAEGRRIYQLCRKERVDLLQEEVTSI